MNVRQGDDAAVVKRIVLVGGGGFYGRYLLDDVLARTDAVVTVASRSPRSPTSSRVDTASVDLHDTRRLREVIRGAAAVVHCAGPFEQLPLEVVDAAIDERVPYIDIAENRAFAAEVRRRHPAALAARVPILTGASVAPGLQLLMAADAAARMDRVLSVEAFAAPDTRKHRGAGMFRTMLYGAGRSFNEPTFDGTVVARHGWTLRTRVRFPPPLGDRWTYLVYGMADLDLVPELVGPADVRFWAGSEIEIANRLLMLAAKVRARLGWPEWERLTPLLRALSWLFGRLGRDEGGVILEVSGIRNAVPHRDSFAIVGVPDGGRIPVLLAGMAVERLCAGTPMRPGVVSANDWTTLADVQDACRVRGLPTWRRTGSSDGAFGPWVES